jgi:hypothetical protein
MAASSSAFAPEANPNTIEFIYVGRTALTAIGPVTGASYRFNQPGARLQVDTRDAASMAQVPVLRQVVTTARA